MLGLKEVFPDHKVSLKEYEKITPKEVGLLRGLARDLKGKEVIHINSAAVGGGVAEILSSQVPLEKKLGLKSRWFVLKAPVEFFEVTKKLHNLLQGKLGALTEEEIGIYVSTSKRIGEEFEKLLKGSRGGVLVIHDPQPAPLIYHIPDNWFPILRFHIDLSSPNPAAVEFMKKYIEKFPSVIVSASEYLKPLELKKSQRSKVINPAINPFSEKNRDIKMETAESVLENLGINCTKPILTQVSRFDPWKDPIGVIQSYYRAKNKIPNLQLTLAGILFAADDPEAFEMFEKIKKHAKGDPDIYVFADPRQLKSISDELFINALYTASTVVIQKSLREGFGLTVTEAMWKGKAVVAGKTSGTMLQINHNKNGLLVSSVEEAARAVVKLTKNGELRERLGKAARESVRRRFLFSRFVRENLETYISGSKKRL